MADRLGNVPHIMHRVDSCLSDPLAGSISSCFINGDDPDKGREEKVSGKGMENWEEEGEEHRGVRLLQRMREMEAFIVEVFDSVSTVKKAYIGLQEAHCPWDPDKIRIADAGVVSELRKLVSLRDRFRRGVVGDAGVGAGSPLVKVAAPYETALDEFRREINAKEVEIQNLKEELRSGYDGRSHSSKRFGCFRSLGSSAAPTPELFESCMEQVKSASKSFTAQLLSVMRANQWDIAAATGSITHGGGGQGSAAEQAAWGCIPGVQPQHARHMLESFVNRKLFRGFENETFYLDGSLNSLLQPAEFRRDCFAQFLDMCAMDPQKLLGILPTCQFGHFAGNKYLTVVHPKMEEALFGGTQQRGAVFADRHPRTEFYGGFLRLAKAVWLLHLLAFAMDPAPIHFEASMGAKFYPELMDSVVKLSGGRALPEDAVVGFSVSPGFKIGKGILVRTRVLVVPPVS